jgi:hypothetical protein
LPVPALATATRGRSAAEQVDTTAIGDARGEQPRVHVILHVAHQQESALAVAKVQHDRRVVHRPAVVR